MSAISTEVTDNRPHPPPARDEPGKPTDGACPAGDNHAPIPVQGKGYSVCAKCGQRC